MLYELTQKDPMLMTINDLEALAKSASGERRAYLHGIIFARLSLVAAGILPG
jgi:hypothetical protein